LFATASRGGQIVSYLSDEFNLRGTPFIPSASSGRGRQVRSFDYCVDGVDKVKVTDVAWLVPHEHALNNDGLPDFRVVAAFEVEGFDVSLETIRAHLGLYRRISRRHGALVPCYIPLYARAIHRPSYGDNSETVDRKIARRLVLLPANQNNVTVCDGRERRWLRAATATAVNLANAWLA
jgi:hypothetical protein